MVEIIESRHSSFFVRRSQTLQSNLNRDPSNRCQDTVPESRVLDRNDKGSLRNGSGVLTATVPYVRPGTV